MKNKILTVISVIVGIIILFLVRNIYSDYNLKKTVAACTLALKQTSNSLNIEEVEQMCVDKIVKNKK